MENIYKQTPLEGPVSHFKRMIIMRSFCTWIYPD